MYLTYDDPVTGPERHDLDGLSSIEAEAIERATDMDWDEVEIELRGQKPGTMRAALWVLRRRKEPDLQYADFDVPEWRRRLKASLTRDEIADAVDDIIKVTDAGHADRARFLRLLRKVAHDPADIDAALQLPKGEAPVPPPAAAAPAAAAPSPDSVPTTGGSSPTT